MIGGVLCVLVNAFVYSCCVILVLKLKCRVMTAPDSASLENTEAPFSKVLSV